MRTVPHFCTYFDRGFLIQGLALADSLRRHEPNAVLWVLALDTFTEEALKELRAPHIRVVPLRELEATDLGLAATKGARTLVEYYFTISPCWPLHLLREHPEIESILYVDADMYWFASARPILAAMQRCSILLTEHRHPAHLRHHARFGKFNVGILGFANDAAGLECLERWREQCLEWCHDRLEGDRYADQKYLDEWPERYGDSVCVLPRLGVNLAPWNWSRFSYQDKDGQLAIDGQPLELFHFARFRPTRGTWWFQSGQLEYGVMPWWIRQRIYGAYWRGLRDARQRLRRIRPGFDFPRRNSRGWHKAWRASIPRAIFGSDWLRMGPYFISGRFGIGRWSGVILSWIRAKARGSAPDQSAAVKKEASAATG